MTIDQTIPPFLASEVGALALRAAQAMPGSPAANSANRAALEVGVLLRAGKVADAFWAAHCAAGNAAGALSGEAAVEAHRKAADWRKEWRQRSRKQARSA